MLCLNRGGCLKLPRSTFRSHPPGRKNQTMKPFIGALALSLCAFAAQAQDKVADKPADKAPTAQQSKMKTCNQEATGKKGDERKAFMKECLSNKPAAAASAATASASAAGQQDRMKQCNADAKGKKGDERKAFMKECLSNKG